MNLLQKKLAVSPMLPRVVPFGVFLVLTFCQGQFGESSRYWFYLAKTLVGAWLLWTTWPLVAEMRWKFSWEAMVTGVAVFAIWVGLDGLYPKFGNVREPWNPHLQFGQDNLLAWMFVVIRFVGSTVVVPPLEEVFYRSFLYRWIVKPDFQSVSFGLFQVKSFLITALIFGFSHREWLAGILCAFAYQGLVWRKQRLGDAMTAHAITNLLLGLWVVSKGDWHFW